MIGQDFRSYVSPYVSPDRTFLFRKDSVDFKRSDEKKDSIKIFDSIINLWYCKSENFMWSQNGL